ncbi:hypothetical protein YC2023_020408 [Brassica napus]
MSLHPRGPNLRQCLSLILKERSSKYLLTVFGLNFRNFETKLSETRFYQGKYMEVNVEQTFYL